MRLLFVFVFLCGICFGQKMYHVDKTTLYLRDSIIYLKHDMKPINGTVYCVFGEMGKCVNGKQEGLWRDWWDNNGQLLREDHYKEGKLDSIHRGWYDNGQLATEIDYKNGQINGLTRGWHNNGQLEWELHYKDGRPDSLQRRWHMNGRLKTEHNYKEDKLDGLYRIWYKNGWLRVEKNYKNGKLISLKRWDENGKEIELDW